MPRRRVDVTPWKVAVPGFCGVIRCLPDFVARPWQVLREYVSKAGSIPPELRDEDWRSLYKAASERLRRGVAEEAVLKACSYVAWRETHSDESLKWPGPEGGAVNREDWPDFVACRKQCEHLLSDFDLPLAIAAERQEPLPEKDSCLVSALTHPMKQFLEELQRRQLPALFDLQTGALREFLSSSAAEKSSTAGAASTGAAVKQEPGADHRGLCRDLVRGILQKWPNTPPVAGQRMHLGTMMHMITACLDRELGDTWPMHCVFVDGSNEERSRMLSLQSEATLCLAVLSTSTHWGLLCTCKGKPEAVLLDGLRDRTLHDAALAFLEHLRQQQNWSGPYVLQYGNISQDDDWSCGHRVVLCAEAVIKGRGCWPPDVGDHASTWAVTKLCVRNIAKPVKREATAEDPCPSSAKAARRDAAASTGASAAPSTPKRPKRDPNPSTPPAEKPSKKPKTDEDAEAQVVQVADDMVTEALMARRKQKTGSKAKGGKQTPAQLRKAGMELFRSGGLCFNRDYQKLHVAQKDSYEGSTHWPTFLESLAAGRAMKCPSCRMLREKIQAAKDVPADTSEALVPLASGDDAPEVPELPPAPPQRQGVPKQSGLEKWISENRAGVYERRDKNCVFGLLCKVEVNVYGRNGTSGNHFLLKHEGTKLARKRHALVSQEKPAAVCHGVTLGSGECRVDLVSDSCRRWVLGGCMKTQSMSAETQGQQKKPPRKPPPPDVLDQCSYTWKGDELLLRSISCDGFKEGESSCSRCRQICNSKTFHADIALWAWRQEAAEFVRVLVYQSPEKVLQYEEKIRASDYMNFEKAKQEASEVLGLKDPLQRASLIKRKLLGINHKVRTERLHAFLEATLANVSLEQSTLDEKRALDALSTNFCEAVAEGSAQKSNLELAAKVASGGLDKHKAVAAMFHGFFAMQQRLERGQVRLRRSADEETVNELFFLFGLSSGTKEVLKQFGLRIAQNPTMEQQSPLVPQPFMALQNKDRLEVNCRLALDLLNIQKKRCYYLTLDETCWKPTYDILSASGLAKNAEGEDLRSLVVGGHYHRDDDWSMLANAKELPSDKLSRLSIHFFVARTDSQAQAWEVASVPMPAGQSGKAEEFLRWTGCILKALTKSGAPPLGLASDAGGCNALVRQLCLGFMVPPEDVPFFSECLVQPLELPWIPAGLLTWYGQAMHFSLDALHLLKRFSAQHQSPRRVIEWGESWVDLGVGLEARLPLKSFTLHDEQADTESFYRLCPSSYPHRADSFGCVMMCFVSALLSSPWEGGTDLSEEERFLNASLCYFVCLLNRMQASARHGSDWSEHFLPTATLKNVLHSNISAMVAAVFIPTGTSVDPRSYAEKIAEHRFSAIKAPFRGTPSLRDGVLGSHLAHLRQFRDGFVAPPPKPATRLPLNKAQKLLECSLADAITLQSWITMDTSEATLRKDFQSWWKSTGRKLVSKTSKEETEQALQEEVEFEAEECFEEGDAAENEAEEVLIAAEDHVRQKEDLEEISKALSNGELPSTAPAPVAADAVQAEALVPAEDADLEELPPKSFHCLLEQARSMECFKLEGEACEGYAGCRDRQLALMPLLTKFTQSVRLRERHMSVAAILGSERPPLSAYHALQHELALARHATSTDGSRQSRMRTWMSTTASLFAMLEKHDDGDWQIRRAERLKTGTGPSAQVVVFKDHDPATGLVTLSLGQLRTIFRGATVRTKDDGPRKLRSAKPVVQSLPLTSVARCRILRLSKLSEHHYYYSAFSEMLMVDPLGTVVGEVRVREMQEKFGKTVLAFGDRAMRGFHTWQQNAAELLKSLKDPVVPAESPAEIAPAVVQSRMYSWNDFSRTAAGTKCIKEFMETLPLLYEAKEKPILTDGCFSFPISGGSQKSIAWPEVVTLALILCLVVS
ncbi:unnamed protein product [Symbiodinium sp. CCMP2592]|nr:unnamed protein product [Symbiodinium sp. CCMP2592]